MTNFWNIIVQSNTFNFAILLIMIAIVLVKLDIISIIEKIRQSVISKIENANFAKEDAQKQLNSAKDTVKDLEVEISEQLQNAKKNADTFVEQISKNTQQQIEKLEEDIRKTVFAEEKRLSSKLAKDVVTESILQAENKLSDIISQDKALQERLIEESLQELDKVKI